MATTLSVDTAVPAKKPDGENSAVKPLVADENDTGDWYPGKVTTASLKPRSPARIPKFASTSSLPSFRGAEALFDAYVARRANSLRQVTRVADFFEKLAEDSRKYTVSIYKLTQQLGEALVLQHPPHEPTPSTAPNTGDSATTVKKIEPTEMFEDGIFNAIGAVGRTFGEVENHHSSFAASVDEEVVQPLRDVADKYSSTLAPKLDELFILRKRIGKIQRHFEKLEKKHGALVQYCQQEREKMAEQEVSNEVSLFVRTVVLSGKSSKVCPPFTIVHTSRPLKRMRQTGRYLPVFFK